MHIDPMSTDKGFDIDAYWQHGYQFPLRVMSTGEAQRYRDQLQAVEANPPVGTENPLRIYLRNNTHVVMPMAAELARNPCILDQVEKVLGANILCWSCEFFIKEAATDKIVTWHQDLTYWGLGSTEQEVTAWLALSPATLESGCMRFVSGSHKNALLPHRDTFCESNLLSRGQEVAVEVNENEAVDVVLQPGEMSLHHGRVFHASGPNTSADRRIGVAIRYVTPEVRQQVAHRDYAMLVRGIDEHMNWVHIAPPRAAFDQQSLALHHRMADDQRASLAAGAESTVKHIA